MYAVYMTDLAKQELAKTLDYITNDLKAPIAATNLADAVEHRIGLLEKQPYKFNLAQRNAFAERGLRFFARQKIFVVLCDRRKTQKSFNS